MPRITGSTRPVGVLGWPVAHSRSPAMHNAAFAALGLDYVYVPLPVSPVHVGAAVRGLAALGFAGANVTVPHKEAVLAHLDGVSETASAIGSVNTIVVRPDGVLWGDSTDGPGFLADLRACGVDPAGARALILGAGGAARAVAYALAAAGARVAIANRTPERAAMLVEALRRALGPVAPRAQVTAHGLPEALPRLASSSDLIVNATSLGLHGLADPLPWEREVSFRPDQVVYDLVYTQGGTPFLTLAAAAGAITFDGLGMLVQQGARSFELWTGRAAPLEIMRQAVRDS